MTKALQEGQLSFHFSTEKDSLVSKYDEWSFYRNQFIRVAKGTKAVDFVYVDRIQKTTWLIEVKDYRHPSEVTIKPSELADSVAQKVRDSLAGLAAARCNANDSEEQRIAIDAFKTDKIKVVLHMEQGSHLSSYGKVINPVDVLQQLKQRVKAIDPHPRVVDKITTHSKVPWGVS